MIHCYVILLRELMFIFFRIKERTEFEIRRCLEKFDLRLYEEKNQYLKRMLLCAEINISFTHRTYKIVTTQ